MEFVSRHFIVLNAIVVTLLVFSFLKMRRSARQGSMRLKDARDMYNTKEVVVKRIVIDENDPRVKKLGGLKALNVMFNYNGHSWDAYEVLGIPAGSNFENSFLAFEKITKTMDKESKVFMLAALEAVRIHLQTH